MHFQTDMYTKMYGKFLGRAYRGVSRLKEKLMLFKYIAGVGNASSGILV